MVLGLPVQTGTNQAPTENLKLPESRNDFSKDIMPPSTTTESNDDQKASGMATTESVDHVKQSIQEPVVDLTSLIQETNSDASVEHDAGSTQDEDALDEAIQKPSLSQKHKMEKESRSLLSQFQARQGSSDVFNIDNQVQSEILTEDTTSMGGEQTRRRNHYKL